MASQFETSTDCIHLRSVSWICLVCAEEESAYILAAGTGKGTKGVNTFHCAFRWQCCVVISQRSLSSCTVYPCIDAPCTAVHSLLLRPVYECTKYSRTCQCPMYCGTLLWASRELRATSIGAKENANKVLRINELQTCIKLGHRPAQTPTRTNTISVW